MKHASHGLLVNGYPNLKIFNFLFWVMISTFFLVGYGTFSVPHFIKQNFSEAVEGQICMKLDLNWEESTIKIKIMTCFMIFLEVFFSMRFLTNVWKFTKKQNLNMRTFSQYGGTSNRNLYTLRQTYTYYVVIVLWSFSDNVFIVVSHFFDKKMDGKTSFLIHNVLWLILIDFFFGILIPIKHIITSKNSLPVLWHSVAQSQEKRFFLSLRSIEPRRDVESGREILSVPGTSKDTKTKTSKVEGNRKLVNTQDGLPISLAWRSKRQTLVPIEC